MSSVFSRLIFELGLHREMQGRLGAIYLLLTTLADNDTAEDPGGNAYRVVLGRLARYSDTWMYRDLQDLFGARAHE